MFGVLLMGSGIVGYWMKRLNFPVAPLVLALVIGPLLEQSFIGSLEMFPNNPAGIFTGP